MKQEVCGCSQYGLDVKLLETHDGPAMHLVSEIDPYSTSDIPDFSVPVLKCPWCGFHFLYDDITYSFGDAIEIIKNNSDLIMYRRAWHGVQLGKNMGIRFLPSSVLLKGATLPVSDHEFVSSYIEQVDIQSIFVFISDDRNYAWTPSQNDMMSDDWVITEVSK